MHENRWNHIIKKFYHYGYNHVFEELKLALYFKMTSDDDYSDGVSKNIKSILMHYKDQGVTNFTYETLQYDVHEKIGRNSINKNED